MIEVCIHLCARRKGLCRVAEKVRCVVNVKWLVEAFAVRQGILQSHRFWMTY